MYECFHCGCKSVIWQSDFTFEDCGYEYFDEETGEPLEGIVHFCICGNCGAEIEYRVPC